MLKFLILFLITNQAMAFTLNNNFGARFNDDDVNIFVTSNSTCSNAQTSPQELSQMVGAAIQYWNSVPTATLRLHNAGILQTSDTDYLNGHLCVESSCPSNNPNCCNLPVTPTPNDIIIACNTNRADNFPDVGGNPSSILALTLPTNIAGGKIFGSMIIINDTTDTRFRDISYADQIAVVAHELGHAIGLGHSPDSAALMYGDIIPVRQSLGHDDIKGVSFLYPVQLDGCGLFGTTHDHHKDANPSWWLLSLMMGFLLVQLSQWISSRR